MSVVIEHELRDQNKNIQPSTMASIILLEAEIEFVTSNFPSEYLMLPFLGEYLENADEDFTQVYFWSEEWQEA